MPSLTMPIVRSSLLSISLLLASCSSNKFKNEVSPTPDPTAQNDDNKISHTPSPTPTSAPTAAPTPEAPPAQTPTPLPTSVPVEVDPEMDQEFTLGDLHYTPLRRTQVPVQEFLSISDGKKIFDSFKFYLENISLNQPVSSDDLVGKKIREENNDILNTQIPNLMQSSDTFDPQIFSELIRKISFNLRSINSTSNPAYTQFCFSTNAPLRFTVTSHPHGKSTAWILNKADWWSADPRSQLALNLEYPVQILAIDGTPIDDVLNTPLFGFQKRPYQALANRFSQSTFLQELTNDPKRTVQVRLKDGTIKNLFVPMYLVEDTVCSNAGRMIGPMPFNTSHTLLNKSADPEKDCAELISGSILSPKIGVVRISALFKHPYSVCGDSLYMSALKSITSRFATHGVSTVLIDTRSGWGDNSAMAWWTASWFNKRELPLPMAYTRNSSIMQKVVSSGDFALDNPSVYFSPSSSVSSNPWTDEFTNPYILKFKQLLESSDKFQEFFPENSTFSAKKIEMLTDEYCNSACELFTDLMMTTHPASFRSHSSNGHTWGEEDMSGSFTDLLAQANHFKDTFSIQDVRNLYMYRFTNRLVFNFPILRNRRLDGTDFPREGISIRAIDIPVEVQIKHSLTGSKRFEDDPWIQSILNTSSFPFNPSFDPSFNPSLFLEKKATHFPPTAKNPLFFRFGM